jgi:thioredoxin domain-containing protein 5
MHLLNLPISLLYTSFILLAATGIPVSSTELTPDTFDQTVRKGLWFIEHFSPYCSHCAHFKPTWEQLVGEAKEEIPEVKMGTVDCVMYGGAPARLRVPETHF